MLHISLDLILPQSLEERTQEWWFVRGWRWVVSDEILHNNAQELTKPQQEKVVLNIWFEKDKFCVIDKTGKWVFKKLCCYAKERFFFDYMCVGVNGVKMSEITLMTRVKSKDYDKSQRREHKIHIFHLWFKSNERTQNPDLN